MFMLSSIFILMLTAINANFNPHYNLNFLKMLQKRDPTSSLSEITREIEEYMRNRDMMGLREFLNYYNLKMSRAQRRTSMEKETHTSIVIPIKMNILRMPFVGGPCNCRGDVCLCCSNFHTHELLNDETCTRFLYYPEKETSTLAVIMTKNMTGRTLLRDEKPVNLISPGTESCTPVMDYRIYVPKMAKLCVVFNYIKEDKKVKELDVCMSIETRFGELPKPVMITYFDCMKMGPEVKQKKWVRPFKPYPYIVHADETLYAKPPHFVPPPKSSEDTTTVRNYLKKKTVDGVDFWL